ncbi:LysR family transcriptional regulator [Beijerinckia mobilis]|uniref:LysR family transcriptional regulator n=1 Tax=Beijerinckia mobilis TaxID=231434 RepID=UPI00054E608B|nr:LysR family transcriptional regulator [Beijerinckia mobilis]
MQKLDDMITFVRVVERGSFVAAARQLGVPPATVSRKIQELEHRLGIELLRRTTRRVFVTEAGRAFFDNASQALTLIEEAELVAKSYSSKPAGVLRVLAPYTLGILIIDQILPAFQRLYPEVLVYLTLNNEPLDLIEHGFDVAVRLGALPDSTYAVHHLMHAVRRVVASPSYLEKHPPIESVSDLEHHVFLSASIDTPAAGATMTFRKGQEQVPVTLVPRMVSNEASVILNHVLLGEGFALFAEILTEPFLASGALKQVLPDWHSGDPLEASLLFSRHATSDPKVRLFIDFLTNEATTSKKRSTLLLGLRE